MLLGYSEGDYFGSYCSYLVDPVTNAQYDRYKEDGYEKPVTIRLGYHPAIRKPSLYDFRADRIIETLPIVKSDLVLVIGCGYGWLCEALTRLTDCRSVGSDPSQFIQDTIRKPSDLWLKWAIEKNEGLTIESGLGKQIFSRCSNGGLPFSQATVYKESLEDEQSLLNITIPEGVPDYAITEDAWQIIPDVNKMRIKQTMALFGIPLYHYIENELLEG